LLDGMPVPQIQLAIRRGTRVVCEGGPDAARHLAALGAQIDIDGASPLREGQARIAHQVFETMTDQAGIGVFCRNALLGAQFARGRAAEAGRPEETMPFLRSFIGALAQEVGLSLARQAAVQGEGALGQTVPSVVRDLLDAAAHDDVRVLVRGHLAVQKDLTGDDRIDGGRMVGGMSKVRRVARRVAKGVRDAIRATDDATCRLVGTER
jgi:hypothetical protein